MPNEMIHRLPASIDTVVFDLDGTLIESEPDLRAALNRLLQDMGRRAVSRDEVVMMIGDGVPKLVERGLMATSDDDIEDLEGHVARFLTYYEAAPTDLSEAFPGAHELLEALKAAGAKIGVCTNKPEAPSRNILRIFGLDGFVDAVVGGDTLDGIRKPDPRHLAAVIERLGSDPARAVMVGDNANDIGTARALGVPAVAVSFGYPRGPVADLKADAVIDQFEELWDVLASFAS